jgi:hypothetical protein
VSDAFNQQLIKRAQSIRVGDPLEPGCRLGPIVCDAQHKRVSSYVQVGRGGGLWAGQASRAWAWLWVWVWWLSGTEPLTGRASSAATSVQLPTPPLPQVWLDDGANLPAGGKLADPPPLPTPTLTLPPSHPHAATLPDPVLTGRETNGPTASGVM